MDGSRFRDSSSLLTYVIKVTIRRDVRETTTKELKIVQLNIRRSILGRF